jgi:hypothetical protein
MEFGSQYPAQILNTNDVCPLDSAAMLTWLKQNERNF